jgi:hypothetical protein
MSLIYKTLFDTLIEIFLETTFFPLVLVKESDWLELEIYTLRIFLGLYYFQLIFCLPYLFCFFATPLIFNKKNKTKKRKQLKNQSIFISETFTDLSFLFPFSLI